MAEIDHPAVGVIRAVVDFDVDADPVSTGELFIVPNDLEPITGTVVLYTLDRWRLLGMLAAARSGATDDELLLALDAAALVTPDDIDE